MMIFSRPSCDCILCNPILQHTESISTNSVWSVPTETINKDLNDKLEKLQQENERLKCLNQKLIGRPVGITEWEKLEAENKQLKHELKQLSTSKIILNENNGRLEANLKNWEMLASEAQKARYALVDEKNKLKAEIKNLKESIEVYQESNERLQRQKDKYKAELATLLNEMER